eukprot:7336046-Pyramimonas_sp.AAC.1
MGQAAARRTAGGPARDRAFCASTVGVGHPPGQAGLAELALPGAGCLSRLPRSGGLVAEPARQHHGSGGGRMRRRSGRPLAGNRGL